MIAVMVMVMVMVMMVVKGVRVLWLLVPRSM